MQESAGAPHPTAPTFPALQPLVPPATLAALENAARAGTLFPAYSPALVTLLAYRLLSLTPEALYAQTSADRGFCNLVLNARDALAGGYDAFAAQIVNKRYSATALRRLVLQLLLGEDRDFWYQATAPAYLRVLGFSERGRELLRAMKTAATLPILTKLGKPRPWDHPGAYNRLLALDVRATALRALLAGKAVPCGEDYLSSPVTN